MMTPIFENYHQKVSSNRLKDHPMDIEGSIPIIMKLKIGLLGNIDHTRNTTILAIVITTIIIQVMGIITGEYD